MKVLYDLGFTQSYCWLESSRHGPRDPHTSQNHAGAINAAYVLQHISFGKTSCPELMRGAGDALRGLKAWE